VPPSMRILKPPNKFSSTSPAASICKLFFYRFSAMFLRLYIYVEANHLSGCIFL
jgi:hypothetical protein